MAPLGPRDHLNRSQSHRSASHRLLRPIGASATNTTSKRPCSHRGTTFRLFCPPIVICWFCRAVFLDEMARVQPEWVEIHRAGVLRNDLYTAVMYCDDDLCKRRVRQWVDQVEGMTDEELQSGAQCDEYVSLNATLSA